MAERFVNRISDLLKEPEAQTQFSPNFRLESQTQSSRFKMFFNRTGHGELGPGDVEAVSRDGLLVHHQILHSVTFVTLQS